VSREEQAAAAFRRVAEAFRRGEPGRVGLAAVRFAAPPDARATIRARAGELGLPVGDMPVTEFGGDVAIRGETGGFLVFAPDPRFESFSIGASARSSPVSLDAPLTAADFAARARAYLERVTEVPVDWLYVANVEATGGVRSEETDSPAKAPGATVTFGLAWDGCPVLDGGGASVELDGAGVVHRHRVDLWRPVEHIRLANLVSPAEAEARVIARYFGGSGLETAGCRIVGAELGYPMLGPRARQTLAVPVYRFHFGPAGTPTPRGRSCRFSADELVTDDPELRETIAWEWRLPEP
jgi:hypothetical protein